MPTWSWRACGSTPAPPRRSPPGPAWPTRCARARGASCGPRPASGSAEPAAAPGFPRRRMRRRRLVLAFVLPALAAGAAAGCGGSGSPSAADQLARPDYRLVTPPEYVGAPPVGTVGTSVQPAMTSKDVARLRPVIDDWARAVRHGPLRRAAPPVSPPAV